MLYGLQQAGLNWFAFLWQRLLSIGFCQSVIDPGCYIKDDLILICYVDNCLLFCLDDQKITKLIQELKQTFILEDQGDITAYLVIDVIKYFVDAQPQFKLSQPHPIQ
jgi:uncharacterized membrane protein